MLVSGVPSGTSGASSVSATSATSSRAAVSAACGVGVASACCDAGGSLDFAGGFGLSRPLSASVGCGEASDGSGHILALARHHRDRRADLHPVGAFGHQNLRDRAFVDRLELHRRFVGLDLGENVADLTRHRLP